jgi:putative peptidoglycan lipid II flippase
MKRMLGATAVIMLGVMLSRLLGLVRDAVIANRFGQGYETDVYNAAFTIPDVIFYLIAGGALSSAFIPVFTEYMERGEEREAWRLFSIVSVATTVVVGLFIVLGEILVHPLVKAFNPGWQGNRIADTVALTRILLPAQICFFLGGLMMGALQVRRNNFGQAFGPAVYNLGIILGGIYLTRRFGVAGLCWGAVGGAVLGNLVLQWVLVRRAGGKFYTSVFRNFHHPGAKEVWNLMWPILLGLALPQVCPIVNKWFASYLGNGAMSALMNGNRLMQVPLGVFGQACGIAIFPLLAQHAARGERAALRRSTSAGIRLILFLTVPSSVFIATLALPIVQFLYQSGKFTSADANLTATILVAYTIGLFAWSTQAIVARGFYSLKDSKTPVIVGTIVTILFVVANAIVLRVTGAGPQHSAAGACGLALVTSLAAILNTGVLVILLRRKMRGLDVANLLVGTLKIVVASAAFGVACRATLAFLQRHPLHAASASLKLQAGVTLLVCAAAGTAVYAALAFLLRMEETRMVMKLVRRSPQ